MSLHVDRAGSAKRRRERQLRSWLRHEQQTVVMALAEKLHHSAQREVEPHNVPPEPTKASAREGEVREECDILREEKLRTSVRGCRAAAQAGRPRLPVWVTSCAGVRRHGAGGCA